MGKGLPTDPHSYLGSINSGLNVRAIDPVHIIL